SAARSTVRSALRSPKRRTDRSLAVNAPSLITGWAKVLVVTISITRPASSVAFLKSVRILVRVASSEPKGTTSSSWKVTPQAPSSASLVAYSPGSRGARLASPNWSRAVQPTVHRPKENLSSGVGVTMVGSSSVSVAIGPGRRRHSRDRAFVVWNNLCRRCTKVKGHGPAQQSRGTAGEPARAQPRAGRPRGALRSPAALPCRGRRPHRAEPCDRLPSGRRAGRRTPGDRGPPGGLRGGPSGDTAAAGTLHRGRPRAGGEPGLPRRPRAGPGRAGGGRGGGGRGPPRLRGGHCAGRPGRARRDRGRSRRRA